MTSLPTADDAAPKKEGIFGDKLAAAKSTVLSIKSKEVSNNSVTRYMNKLID